MSEPFVLKTLEKRCTSGTHSAFGIHLVPQGTLSAFGIHLVGVALSPESNSEYCCGAVRGYQCLACPWNISAKADYSHAKGPLLQKNGYQAYHLRPLHEPENSDFPMKFINFRHSRESGNPF